MALDKLIIGQIVGVAKSAFKMDIAVEQIKTTLIEKTADEIDKKIPFDLPIDTKDVLSGNVKIPTNLLTPEYLTQVGKEIPENLKQEVRNVLDTVESSLRVTIKTKNDLSGALNTLVKPIQTLEKLSETLTSVITPLKAVVTTLKVLPLPTAIAGVGIPAGVILTFADTLDVMSKVIDKVEGPVSSIAPSVKQIQKVITPIIGKLGLLDPIFENITKIIIFIKVIVDYGPGASQSEINSIAQKTTTDLLSGLATSPGPIVSNSEKENALAELELLDRLNPSSTNPIIYRGYKLEIQYDPNNQYSFPSRRIKGIFINEGSNISSVNLRDIDLILSNRLENDTRYNSPTPKEEQNQHDNNVSLLNSPQNYNHPYSFSSSIQVLISEIYYEIDQFISGNENLIQYQNVNSLPNISNISQSNKKIIPLTQKSTKTN